MLSSTDSELNGVLVSDVLSDWVGDFSPEERRDLMDKLLRNLEADTVLVRSNSIVCLRWMLLPRRPMLHAEDVHELVEACVRYFSTEPDVQVRMIGSIHLMPIGSAAEVLRFLVISPHSTASHHRQILTAVLDKVLQPVDYVYQHEEDIHLTYIILEILNRQTLQNAEVIDILEERAWHRYPELSIPYTNARYFTQSLYFGLMGIAEYHPQFQPIADSMLKIARQYSKMWNLGYGMHLEEA
jgi:hypothetical protein